MTEPEWLTTTNLTKLSSYLQGHGTLRKHRLAICGCVRLVWGQLTDIRSRQAVEASERFADGGCKRKDLHRAYMNAKAATAVVRRVHSYMTPEYSRVTAAESTARKDSELSWGIGGTGSYVTATAVSDEERKLLTSAQADLVRCIFGNPFRPVTFLPEWRTSTVMALAQQMYNSHDFGAMPILADALQDIGCEDEAILTHCRGPGPHVRGCWVTDAILGRG